MVSYYPLGYLRFIAFLSIIYSPTNYATLYDAGQPELTITQGTLVGTTLTTRYGRTISAFLGIPFGQPPIGNLRFANPVAADGWNGIRNASVNANKCPQIMGNVQLGDEDCLNLKVYTPQLPQNKNAPLLPVMVYIHGGAFKIESPDRNTPEYLLDADVVLVVINYRLGALGFLSTGDEVASGNWGLKDQVLALKWVQNNVRYFGGDPNEVTIFGSSAGAGSVHLLLVSDTTIGLFHKCITQSGSILAPWAHRSRPIYSRLAFKLGEYVGCNNDTSDSLISCLRTVKFFDILTTQSKFVPWNFILDVTWGPTDEPDMDGAFLTDSPSNLVAAGATRDVPWISGVVRDEGLAMSRVFHENEEYLNECLENFDAILPSMMYWDQQSNGPFTTQINAVKSYYFNNDLRSNSSVLRQNITKLLSDVHFFYPAYETLQRQYIPAVNPLYFYIFNYVGTGTVTDLSGGSGANYGVAHSDELIYLFPREPQLLALNKTLSESDYEMVDTLMQLWTSFAITGKPTASTLNGTVTWEPYSAEGKYLRIGNGSDLALEVETSFFPEQMQFWAALEAATATQDD